jgi:hypothetical protein
MIAFGDGFGYTPQALASAGAKEFLFNLQH